jgi:hypothetical protein
LLGFLSGLWHLGCHQLEVRLGIEAELRHWFRRRNAPLAEDAAAESLSPPTSPRLGTGARSVAGTTYEN